MRSFFCLFFASLLLQPSPTLADCTCDPTGPDISRSRALPLKIIAIITILLAGFFGVCIPTLGKCLPSLRPEKNLFFVLKAFAAGVILSTAFIHVLPDAFESLTSPCLPPSPWQDFPFAGFCAMVAAIATLIVDTVATGYFRRATADRAQQVPDQEKSLGDAVEVHAHATHSHSHGTVGGAVDLVRHRVTTQVLELGIVVHSVIIGISLGSSQTPSTIKPLLVALCFHQFFEGMGLGGCLAQAKFRAKSMIAMILFFCLTTPVGVAIGIGISTVYNENTSTALIVEGVLNSAAAGILIYMALVDLLAADFMNPRIQNNGKLQLGVNISLLLGAGLMSVLAKWA